MFSKVHIARMMHFLLRAFAVCVFLQYPVEAMAQKPRMLKTVVVKPGVNPADRIVKRAVANIDSNNYRNLDAFTYDLYNQAFIRRHGDTAYLFFSENAAKHAYLAPDHDKEQVVATRTTGTRKKIFASILSQLQSASFYKPEIDFLDMKFVNPLSEGTLERYYFELRDTLYEGGDTTFVMFFRPRMNQDFVGLTGTIGISSHRYALRFVDAEPSGRFSNLFGSLMNDISTSMTFRHEFAKDSSGRWMPARYITVFELETQGERLDFEARSDYLNFNTSPSLSLQDFRNADDVEVDPRSEYRDNEFWEGYRLAADDAERRRADRCFELYDSLNVKMDGMDQMDKMFNVVEALVEGLLPLWESRERPQGVNLDINSLYNHNDYEGTRLGLGGEYFYYLNNHNVKLSAGGYLAYGFRDGGWKYGISMAAASLENHRPALRLFADNDVAPFAPSSLTAYNLLDISNNANYCYELMTRVRRVGAKFSWRQSRHLDLSLTARCSEESCLFDSLHRAAVLPLVRYTEGVVGVSWQSGVKKMALAGEGSGRYSLSQSPSRASVAIEVVMGVASDADMPYIRALLQYDHNIRIPRYGDLILMARTGYASHSAPCGRMFSLGGTGTSRYYYRNSLLTLMPNRFAAHAFGQVGVCYIFEKPLWNVQLVRNVLASRPFPFVQVNALAGTFVGADGMPAPYNTLSTTTIGTLEAPVLGIVEPAVGLDGLLRWKIVDAGAVIACNAASYRAAQFFDNIAVLFMLNIRID